MYHQIECSVTELFCILIQTRNQTWVQNLAMTQIELYEWTCTFSELLLVYLHER